MPTYGHSKTVRDLFAAAVAASSNLPGQLAALVQEAHRRPVEGTDVEKARALLFARHGWR